MGEQGLLSRLNRSKLLLGIVCGAVFLVLLFCNFRTNLIADDYRYCFSFADDSPMDSLGDIIPSMTAHRNSMNGRIAAHALVQLFLMLPLWIFKVLNSLMFVFLLLLIYKISAREQGEGNLMLLLSVFGGIWVLQEDFGQVFLWLDGAINYLWSAVFSLLFLLPFVDKFLRNRELSPWGAAAFAVLSFIVGGYSENSAVAVLFMAVALMLLCRFYQKKKLRPWVYISLVAAVAGFVFMISAPGEFANKSAELSLAVLGANLLETGKHYLHFWPLLLCFAAFYWGAVKAKLPMELRLLSLVLFAGSLAGHFVLAAASYITWRSTYITLVLLLAACGVLFSPLYKTSGRLPLSLLCAVTLCFTFYWGYTGIRDIQSSYINLTFNEELLADCAAKGEQDVQLPRYYSQTRYSALSGLAYLDTEDPNYWTNVYMARYYGVDSIIGY